MTIRKPYSGDPDYWEKLDEWKKAVKHYKEHDYVVLGKAEDGFWVTVRDYESYCTIANTAATEHTRESAFVKDMDSLPDGSWMYIYIQDGEVRAY